MVDCAGETRCTYCDNEIFKHSTDGFRFALPILPPFTHNPIIMTGFLIRIFIAVTICCNILGCTTTPAYHTLTYFQTDNQNISLLAWEYSNRQRSSFNNNQLGIGNFSHGFNLLGDDIKIQWLDRKNKIINSKSIKLKQNTPFNMNGAEILISFNKNNEPEIYIFYENPLATKYFKFRGHVYTNRRMKMIFPEVKNIETQEYESKE